MIGFCFACVCSTIYTSGVRVAIFTLSCALLKLLVSLSNGALGRFKVVYVSYALRDRAPTCTRQVVLAMRVATFRWCVVSTSGLERGVLSTVEARSANAEL